jgi:hypothetical protein
MYWDTGTSCLRRWDPTIFNFAGTQVGAWTHTKYNVNGSGNPTGFTASLFTNSWTDSASSPHNYGVLVIWKDLEGCVHLEGGFHNLSPSSFAALTLPVGFRPATSIWFGSAMTNETTTGNVVSINSASGVLTVLNTNVTDVCLTGLIYSTS